MGQLRVLMQPIRAEGPSERTTVSGFTLRFSALGRVSGPPLDGASATVELTCLLVSNIRQNVRSDPAPLATLMGTLSLRNGAAELRVDRPAQQDASLTDVLEQDGHRRPRRKLRARMPDGSELALLLPDLVQVPSGFMEVMAKLTVNGVVHADVGQNAVLDVPLLPLGLTHAVFHFVDGTTEPLKRLRASFQSSLGETLEAETDDFGELFLEASQGQSYTLLEVLPGDEDRLAVVETSISGGDTAVA